MAEEEVKAYGENILKFVTDKGWKFMGNCGCKNAMDVYRHTDPLYKGWEIWLGAGNKRMEVRRRFNEYERNAQIKGIATVLNYITVYHHHLPQIS